MSQHSNPSTPHTNVFHHKLRYGAYFLISLCSLFLLAAIFLPTFTDTKVNFNEVAAAGRIRRIGALQFQYAKAHKETGFACELELLTPDQPEPIQENYHPDGFLTTGTQAGYKFAISGCHAETKGVVVHYQTTAVPAVPGKTGVRAFCADESGVIWYDSGGSATNCLTFRHPI